MAWHGLADRSGLLTQMRIGPGAGHRVLLAGEPLPGPAIVHGGSPEADAAFGALVRPRLLELLRLPAAEGLR